MRVHTVMTGMIWLDVHVKEFRRDIGSTYLMLPLTKFKLEIYCNKMHCNSCSFFSASCMAILGSQLNGLIICKMPIAM